MLMGRGLTVDLPAVLPSCALSEVIAGELYVAWGGLPPSHSYKYNNIN